jgi:hypothetical protein
MEADPGAQLGTGHSCAGLVIRKHNSIFVAGVKSTVMRKKKTSSQQRVASRTQSVGFVIIAALDEERDAVLSNLGRMRKLDNETLS